MRVVPCLVFVVGLLAACGGDERGSKPAASAAPGAPAGTDKPVVIEVGPDGKTKVQGGDVKGDAATCASMNACCGASSDVSLFCGLAKATQGATCASVLKETQSYLSERKLAKPADCP